MKPAESPRYLCSVSGLSAAALPDEVMAVVPDEDPLDDLPLGWSRVTVETRMENPRYMVFVEARQTLIDQTLSMKENAEETTEHERALVEMLVDAQLGAVAVPPFVVVTEELYVHPDYMSHLSDALGVEGEEGAEDLPVVPENGSADAPVQPEG